MEKEMVVLVTSDVIAVRTFERDGVDNTFATDLAGVFNTFGAQATTNRVKARNKTAFKSYPRGWFDVDAGASPTNSVDVGALVDEIPADVIYVKNLTKETIDVYADAGTETLSCGSVLVADERQRSFFVVPAPASAVKKILG